MASSEVDLYGHIFDSEFNSDTFVFKLGVAECLKTIKNVLPNRDGRPLDHVYKNINFASLTIVRCLQQLFEKSINISLEFLVTAK